ncbi:MAG: hypothetical protein ACR2KK_09080 [Acidimicrobiales bacterium]
MRLLRRASDRPSRWITPWVAMRLLVVIAAGGLVWSYLLTWELWQPRSDPPNLPLVAMLRSIQFGVPLAAAALLAIAYPRVGATLHTLLLGLALLADQIRLQPQFVSLAIVLVAAAWSPKGLHVARWHLISLWAWAGIHKALSAGWATWGAHFIASATGHRGLRPVVAVALPVCEIGLAALALSPRTWPLLRVAAPLFHLIAFANLVMADVSNTSVWPWNLALAAATPLLFRSLAPGDRAPVQRSPVALATALVFAVYPLGFYVGASDAYLSHNLYTSNTAEASICPSGSAEAGGLCFPAFLSTLTTLNVPLPPERRLFVGWFRRTCQPGDQLRIDGISTRLSSRRTMYVACGDAT